MVFEIFYYVTDLVNIEYTETLLLFITDNPSSSIRVKVPLKSNPTRGTEKIGKQVLQSVAM